MPPTDVCFFLASDGTVPVLDWLRQLRRDIERAIRRRITFEADPDNHIWEETEDGQEDA